MTIIVEDGTAKPDSESYCSVSEADKYLKNHGKLAGWEDLGSEDKEIHLRNATAYMIQTYRGRWKGARVKYTQALDWPRQGVDMDDGENTSGGRLAYLLPADTVPREVKDACAELAFRAMSGPLLDDLGQAVKTVRVGPIIKEYDTNSPRHKQYAAIDRILDPLMSDLSSSGGSSLKITRC